MAKILVTGGAGFIGGNFLSLMVKKYPKDKFVCLDALTYAGNKKILMPIINQPNFKFIKLNICDRKNINNLFKKERFDYVINFAAETHVDRSINNPEVFTTTNIIGTQVLLDASVKFKIKRFHQISTDEVYGDIPIKDNKTRFNEKSPLHPSSPYSASKAAADLLVLAYHRTYKLPISISRSSNNFGPYQYEEKLIPLLIKRAINNKSLPIYGDGINVRDWIYVIDHCVAIDLILRKGKNGEIYNISGNNYYSNLEIAKLILKELNKSESLIKFIKDRPGHDLRYSLDASKIYKKLKFKPKNKFKRAIKLTINSYIKSIK